MGDHLAYVAGIFGVQGVDAQVRRALETTNTVEVRYARMGELSGGQRQRVFLAGALVHSPDVLILDEPTVGLDPGERIGFRKHLMAAARSRCVVLSTHLMDDVALAADRVRVVAGGQLRWQGSVSDLAAVGVRGGEAAGVSPAEAGYLSLIGEFDRA